MGVYFIFHLFIYIFYFFANLNKTKTKEIIKITIFNLILFLVIFYITNPYQLILFKKSMAFFIIILNLQVVHLE